MRWLFVAIGFSKFDIKSVDERPIGGTESSLIYLMKSLAKSGHETHFFTPLADDIIIKNINQRCLNNVSDIKNIKADVIVYVGETTLIKQIKEIHKNIPLIYWEHQASNQGWVLAFKNDLELLNNISIIIFASRWQKKDFETSFNLNNLRSEIIHHGITLDFVNMFSDFNNFIEQKTIHEGIYASYPNRGLSALYSAEQFLKNNDLTIKIFSSAKVYQRSDTRYLKLYDDIKKKNFFRYNGSVTKKNLALRHKNKSFLIYPCTWAETFCLTALDAVASGCEIISTNLGCLKEIFNNYGKFLNIKDIKNFDSFVKQYSDLVIDTLNFKKKILIHGRKKGTMI